jgi:hypothetical protein
MNNPHGQILLPGLGLFLGLMMLFLALVAYGRHILKQMRVTMVAEATALSVARAQADMMNKFASYNDSINPILFPAYKGYAAVQVDAVKTLKYLAEYQHIWQLPKFHIYPVQVGRWIAKTNGCDPNPKFIPTPSLLIFQDIEAFLMKGQYPASLWPIELKEMYYARTWYPNKRKVQPPHQTHWLVSKEGVKGTSSARLYLDVQPNERWQNGGFPSVNSEHWWDDAQIQSFYPQFNAKLLPGTPLGFRKILERL